MPIQYGELTIIKENDPKSLFDWITNKEYIEKYIFLFEDGEICDTIVDFHFEFLDSITMYFEKEIQSKR